MQRAFLNYCHLPDRMRATPLHISSPALARLPSESEGEWATPFTVRIQRDHFVLVAPFLDLGLAVCATILASWRSVRGRGYRGTSIVGTKIASACRRIIVSG